MTRTPGIALAAFAVLALIAGLGTSAQAEFGEEIVARAPKTVGALLPWCGDHFKDCGVLVAVTDAEHIAEGPSPGACVIGTRHGEAATKSILAWLAAHKETHAAPTDAGIAAAINALWPC
jgi:hypothetical protein